MTLKTYNCTNTINLFPNEYTLHLAYSPIHGFVAGSSDGILKQFSLIGDNKFSTSKIISNKLSTSSSELEKINNNTIVPERISVNGLKIPQDDGNVVVAAFSNGIKLWDLRSLSNSLNPNGIEPNIKINLEKKFNPLCMDYSNGKVVAGTDKVGEDAGVILWDVRKPTEPLIRYMDSHNDDVTVVHFHPENDNMLLTGAEDGLINVYDLSISDEDEAVYQTINHGASIHKAGFMSSKVIYALSRMETFGLYNLLSVAEIESSEAKVDLHMYGDLRETIGCEYVIDVSPIYVASGSNSESKLNITGISNYKINTNDQISLEGAHGDEVVRCLYTAPGLQYIVSGGEDGTVKLWKDSGKGIKHNRSKVGETKQDGLRFKPY